MIVYQLLCIMMISLSSPIIGNFATLDTSFAGTGYTFLNNNWISQQQIATVMQPDGKIIILGNAQISNQMPNQISLIRFNTDGSLDETFNATGSLGISATPGYLTYTVPGNTNYTPIMSSYGICLQSDGTIFVTGTIAVTQDGWPSMFIVKFNADGTLNTTFGVAPGITPNNGTNAATVGFVIGNPGSILFSYLNTASCFTIIQNANRNIIIAGQQGNGYPFCLRFLESGALDTLANGGLGFGPLVNGIAPGYMSISSPYQENIYGSLAKSLAVDSNQNIYMAGQYNPNPVINPTINTFYPIIFQLNSSGILNTSYGTVVLESGQYGMTTGAIISTNLTTMQGSFTQIFIQRDEKAVAIGSASIDNGGTYQMIIARFTPTGQLDTTFGNGAGYILNPLSSTGQGICSNHLGKYIASGSYGTSSYSTVFRFNYDGSLDTTFAANGYLVLNSINYTNITLGNGITADGKIHLGATINSKSGAFQILGSNNNNALNLEIYTYGTNATYFAQFLYVTNFAQIITDSSAQRTTIEGMQIILDNYARIYAEQKNFNYILYFYLLKSQINALQDALLIEYPSSSAQINTFFINIIERINYISAIQS